MNKNIAIIAGLVLSALTAFAVEYGAIKLVDSSTTSGTIYIGETQVTENTSPVSTNSAVWSIKKIVTDASGDVTITEAYSTNSVQKKTTNKWSLRATTNVTYKSIQ